MGKSLKEYVTALGYWGLIVIAPITLDVIGIYQLAYGNQFTGVPSWVWFQVAFVLFLIITFVAFHKLRLQRDELRKKLDDNTIARHIIAVYLVSYQFILIEGGLTIRLLPEIHAIPGVKVEDIQFEIKGKRYETDWKPMGEPISGDIGDYINADIPTLKAGTYKARIIACIDNKEYPSDTFNVSYPQSNPYMEVTPT